MSRSVTSLVTKAHWEHFPHNADIGMRGFGATAAEAFEQGACALTTVVSHAEVKRLVAIEVRCEAPDLELLFVEWLNAIIYEMAVRDMLFGRFAVERALRERCGANRSTLSATLRPASRKGQRIRRSKSSRTTGCGRRRASSTSRG
jgi:SHS2 domain-containing protein